MNHRPALFSICFAMWAGIGSVWLSASACRDQSARLPSGHDEAKSSDSEQAEPGLGVDRSANRSANRSVDRRSERVVVTEVAIEVVEQSGRESVELYTRELGQQMGQLLVTSGLYLAQVEDVEPGYTQREAALAIQIKYESSPDLEGGSALLVTVTSELVWADRGADLAPMAQVFAERPWNPAEGGDRDGIIAATVAATVTRAGHILIAQEQVRVSDSKGLQSALESADVELALWSLALIAERRDADFYTRVVSALGSDESLIRDGALAALVAIGDRRAVDVLTKRAAFDDPEFMALVLDAVVALGGADAREYLEFIASGHPSEALRARAASGLVELNRAAQP